MGLKMKQSFRRKKGLYVADTNNHRIRRINIKTQEVDTFAGLDYMKSDEAFNSPRGITKDIILTNNHRIRRINIKTQRSSIRWVGF